MSNTNYAHDIDGSIINSNEADHEWEFAHESLARVYREVKKALEVWRKEYPKGDISLPMVDFDEEVRYEIENLIQTLIEDIENDS